MTLKIKVVLLNSLNGSLVGKETFSFPMERFKNISIFCRTLVEYENVYQYFVKLGFRIELFLHTHEKSLCFEKFPYLHDTGVHFGCNSGPKFDYKVISYSEFLKLTKKYKEPKWKNAWKGEK